MKASRARSGRVQSELAFWYVEPLLQMYSPPEKGSFVQDICNLWCCPSFALWSLSVWHSCLFSNLQFSSRSLVPQECFYCRTWLASWALCWTVVVDSSESKVGRSCFCISFLQQHTVQTTCHILISITKHWSLQENMTWRCQICKLWQKEHQNGKHV